MKSIACLLTLILILPFAKGDDADARARAALALACADPGKPASVDYPLTYAQAYSIAISQNRPLIVFVGQPERNVPGCLTCCEGSFPDFQGGRGVVVSRPQGGGRLIRLADLPGTPSDVEILAALNPPASTAGVSDSQRAQGAGGSFFAEEPVRAAPVFRQPTRSFSRGRSC